MQLGDWLALTRASKQRHGSNGLQPGCYRATGFSPEHGKAAKILDYQADDFYQKLADEIKEAILACYFNGDDLNLTPETLNSPTEQIRQQMAQGFAGKKIATKVDTQTGLALLLHYHLYPTAAARQKLASRLKERLAETNCSLTTGLPARLSSYTLSENGLDEEAFDSCLKKTARRLFEISQGATTTWERWDSLLSEGHISSTDMNSMNHYAYGSVEDFIIEKMLGINLP